MARGNRRASASSGTSARSEARCFGSLRQRLLVGRDRATQEAALREVRAEIGHRAGSPSGEPAASRKSRFWWMWIARPISPRMRYSAREREVAASRQSRREAQRGREQRFRAIEIASSTASSADCRAVSASFGARASPPNARESHLIAASRRVHARCGAPIRDARRRRGSSARAAARGRLRSWCSSDSSAAQRLAVAAHHESRASRLEDADEPARPRARRRTRASSASHSGAGSRAPRRRTEIGTGAAFAAANASRTTARPRTRRRQQSRQRHSHGPAPASPSLSRSRPSRLRSPAARPRGDRRRPSP